MKPEWTGVDFAAVNGKVHYDHETGELNITISPTGGVPAPLHALLMAAIASAIGSLKELTSDPGAQAAIAALEATLGRLLSGAGLGIAQQKDNGYN
jgi:hypothetical protein